MTQEAAMNRKTISARRVAWGIWGLTLAVLAVWPFLGGAAGRLREELIFYSVVPVAVISYATVGALITSRHPENRIGLILAGVALAFAIALTAGDYATLAVRRPDSLPFAPWVAWLGRVTFALWLAPLPLLFLLYPNGRLGSRRWRPVLWVLLAALGVNLSLYALTPGSLVTGFAEIGGAIPNPLGLPITWKAAIENATELAGLVALVCAGLAILSLVLRFRRSSGMERQQIRWLGYVGAVLVAVPLLVLLIALVRSLIGVNVVVENDPVGVAAWISFFAVLLFGVPAACAIAILRYRLYQLDVVVKRTVVFAVLVVLLTAVGALAGVLLGSGIVPSISDNPPMLLLTGIGYGLLAIPLYRLAKRIADRIVFGGRSTPYEVLSDFSERVGGTYSSVDVLPRMAQLLGEATRAKTARVWLRVRGELHASATWPAMSNTRPALQIRGDQLPTIEAETAFEVRDRGELLGALSVELTPNDPMDPSKEQLAADLARQAGLVLRNVRLLEELRESRRRIVATQDERAKKLERDIHDGAQQQLVALAIKQRLAASLVGKDEEQLRSLLQTLQSETTQALEDLRDLAHGIYPPLLADKGLGAALESQARKSSIQVHVEADGGGRFSPEVEAAVYFCCLEALQNVVKYAAASQVAVRLTEKDGTLTFEVSDDGRGFDPNAAQRGSGLQGMADRIEAVGGMLVVESGAGAGTTVRGRIPPRAMGSTG
jgi:signal transduction histidine kinase